MLKRVLEPEIMDSAEDAAEYAAIDNSANNEEFVRDLRMELGFKGGRLIDLGTGPADIAIAIARQIPEAQVTAVDLGLHMMSVARQKVAAAPERERIELVETDAKDTGFAAASFDFVVCNSLVHHVHDPILLFREIGRIARPGAGIFLKDLKRPATRAELEHLVARYAAHDTLYQRRLFRDSLHAALRPEEITDLACAAGLTNVQVTVASDRHWQLTRPMRK